MIEVRKANDFGGDSNVLGLPCEFLDIENVREKVGEELPGYPKAQMRSWTSRLAEIVFEARWTLLASPCNISKSVKPND